MNNEVERRVIEAYTDLRDLIGQLQGRIDPSIATVDHTKYDQRKIAIARTHLETAQLWMKEAFAGYRS